MSALRGLFFYLYLSTDSLNESFIGETLGNPTFICTFVKA